MISLEANFSSVPRVETGLSTEDNHTGEKGAASSSCPHENLSVGPERQQEIPPAKLLWRPDFKMREAIQLKAREEKSFVDFILVLHIAKIFRHNLHRNQQQQQVGPTWRWLKHAGGHGQGKVVRQATQRAPRADRDISQSTMGSLEELGFKVSTKSVMNFLLCAN